LRRRRRFIVGFCIEQMSTQSTKEDFSELPLFVGISDQSLALINPEMISFFEPGEAILLRGAQVKNLVVLLEGEVCVFVDDTFLVARRAPAVIGEQAFIDEPVHSATVKALGVVRALVLSVRPAGRSYLGVKVSCEPDRGNR
jgi:CRP-like cAMP-binding protein